MTFLGLIYEQLFVKPTYPTTSCAGQTIIVTGSNVGLGKEAARHFARLGASKLILAVRNTKAGEAAKHDIESTTRCSPEVIEVWPLDLSSYASVKAFADRASELPRLDVLLENAGIAAVKWQVFEGHESTLTVNVISTFYLALLLLPKLKSSAKQFGIKPRLTIVSSAVHAQAKFAEWKEPKIFDALDNESKFDVWERYPLSKLLEVLVVRQIAPGVEGSGVILNILNPGLCHSELARDAGWPLTVMKFFLARTTEVGSRTLVAAAVAGPEAQGKYMHNGKVDESVVSPFVKSEDGKLAAEKVWKELSAILEAIQPGVTSNL
ncbi:Short chain dehydrogenase sol3 [Lachnellula cervina]|uniref:Short chain dehydrogenase sol3 n=1 Tax=Lachnellula cervina TaxID=1316786 RepID=A0A7D8UP01_9HELO|nr:Short chain dehydrogenase sol3 [Lachnellula cervina]